MKKYQSHKVVEAAQITGFWMGSRNAVQAGGQEIKVPADFFARGIPEAGDYLVRYQPDGYLSWSPKAAFEAGYREIGTPAAVEVTVTAPAGKRAEVTMMRGDADDSVWTVTEGQSQTWACLGGEAIEVREGEPHSSVAHKRGNG